jgi:tripartite-type tricarboxylate transporter receptor subunit TctC
MLFRVLALSLTAVLVASTAAAQTFPTKPVKIIVPQTPGGASDALARIVGQKLSEKWGQPVVVENRPGAGGNIGMDAVAKSPADGYTLLMSYVGTHAINGALYKKLPFDPEKDFTATATLATLPFVVVVNPKMPAKSVQELAAMSKETQVTYGSAGNGSVNHLLGEMFNSAAQAKLVHVPYKGAAPALQDLMGGQISAVFTSMPSVAQFIRAGTLRPLAVTSAKRSESFKDIPTIAESGYPGFDVNPWFGLFVPAGTPPEIVRQLNADINAVLKQKETAEKFAAQGAEVHESTPEQFAATLKSDIVKWEKIVRDSGAKID